MNIKTGMLQEGVRFNFKSLKFHFCTYVWQMINTETLKFTVVIHPSNFLTIADSFRAATGTAGRL